MPDEPRSSHAWERAGRWARGRPHRRGSCPALLVPVGFRWVRNPIYIAALLVVVGEAWLFLSPRLLYAGTVAIFFHLLVIGYEEPTLRRRFGETYAEYPRTVPRWVLRPPRSG